MKANRIVVLAMACACLSAATPGQTQTTNTWVIPPSTQDLLWNDTANWTPGTVPNGNTHWAVFEGDYKTDVTYTARLGNDITLAGLSFFDTTTANYPWLTITNTPLVTLTWDGGSGPARITVTNAGGTTASTVQFHSGVTNYIGANGLIKDGPGSLLIWRLAGPGNLTVDRGTVELRDNNLNFSGALIITNSGGLDFRGSNVPHAGGIGNQPITIYNSGIFRYRESSNVTLTNSFILRGIHQNGSLYFYQTTNITYTGTVRLETNSSISLGLWEQTSNSVTHRKDVFFSGKIEDDGNNRNLHLVNHQAIVNIGPNARLSRFVLSGTAEHGGFTHLTGSREPEPNGTSDFFLQLTNGNNRLPTGTTLYLGGRMTSGATTVGAWGASGILILAGSDQELAGLVVSTQGTGVNNRVVGGVATNNTLTLNIAAATTNLYSGFLGGTNTFENNLALTKKGSGTLRLSAATNTFSGLTTVEAGTLVIAGN
ncbi:MAG: autotransporter-associated beta strand repeat-containing protein, partial [Kiritimatiellia bacterium]|nr:autotransporter-associated beta strand repeat-containing protein [Kiritimatiellia bacterium]